MESSEQITIMEFNVRQTNRRLDGFKEMIARHGQDNFSVYHTSDWKPKLQTLPKSNYGTPKLMNSQDSQRSLRKIDTRELITGILETGFIHFLLFIKQWVTDMFYGLQQIHFFR